MIRFLSRSSLIRVSSSLTSSVNGGRNSGNRILLVAAVTNGFPPENHPWRSSMAVAEFRRKMTSSPPVSEKSVTEEGKESSTPVEKKKNEIVSSYWGISKDKITRDDGSEWPWNCFMPWDTYRADISIDLTKHHVPKKFIDKLAYRTVKLLRIPTDIFFQRRYGCRAMMLETVAGVPGIVGGMLLHLRSLRRFEQSGGWIKAFRRS